MTEKWWSYNPVASCYDRLHVPHFFLRPAKDLVAMLGLLPRQRVLDIGTGTGVAAREALEAVGPQGVVLGIDPSQGMLRRAKGPVQVQWVVAQCPGLPFAESTFDAVSACFVISHFDCYQAALSDAVRVLGAGGKLGAISWGVNRNPFLQAWQEVVSSFISADGMSAALSQALPWEEQFADAARLRVALEEAGLEDVQVQQREYRISMTVDEYLACREISMPGRYLRRMLTGSQWNQFRRQVEQLFASRFCGPLEYTNVAHLAVGSKLRTR